MNLIAPHLKGSIDNQIKLLEEKNIVKRLTFLSEIISNNIELLQLEKKIKFEVKKKIDKSQKEYYLNEQIKEMQKELGNIGDDDIQTPEDFKKKIDELGLPEYAKTKAIKEHNRLLKMPWRVSWKLML